MQFFPLKSESVYEVPTGHIVVAHGDHGLIEYLSIGDYGKDVNLKCDALGLTRELKKVKHVDMLPLEEKWVITISSQYGCSMGCNFCDVPKVGPGKNATVRDLVGQILAARELHPEVKNTDRLNIHFARMGEPTFNFNVLHVAQRLSVVGNELLSLDTKTIHPVVSTMLPKNNKLLSVFLHDWMSIKNNDYKGEAGLQFSINSTCESEREVMFSGDALTLSEIGKLSQKLPDPVGRKITLNFAVANYEIDPNVLLRHFDPRNYIVKLTPMHMTTAALKNNIMTSGDYTSYYPYKYYEESLRNAGYDVLVFIASKEEDEGRITCGNAVLSGTRPFDLD
jgi:23S rRNA (adenine2503-C2)-methyltransferase